ncbi:hypothetical protein JCM6882_007544 [Rhodosporidiobolus microsporus]
MQLFEDLLEVSTPYEIEGHPKGEMSLRSVFAKVLGGTSEDFDLTARQLLQDAKTISQPHVQKLLLLMRSMIFDLNLQHRRIENIFRNFPPLVHVSYFAFVVAADWPYLANLFSPETLHRALTLFTLLHHAASDDPPPAYTSTSVNHTFTELVRSLTGDQSFPDIDAPNALVRRLRSLTGSLVPLPMALCFRPDTMTIHSFSAAPEMKDQPLVEKKLVRLDGPFVPPQ